MGREWYRSMITKGADHHPHHHQRQSTVGCMSGMLQLFDFHHVLFTAPASGTTGAAQDASLSSPHSYLKGVEAPRNSLELDETVAAAAVSTSSIGEEFYGIPVGITIRKNRKDLQLWVEEEEEEEEEKRNNSQVGTPRTPNVVARLMGLDILPDGASTPSIMAGFRSLDHSPKSSIRRKMMKKNVVIKDKQCIDESPPPPRRPLQKKDSNVILGSRSLPDTPRASSERSRDVDPRLSLQINSNHKENYCSTNYNRAKELAYLCEVGRKSNNQEENNRSPRSQSYAREIVKQVKESINRRGFSNSNSTEICTSKQTRPTDKKVDHEIKTFAATKPQKIHQAESRRENPEAIGSIKHCKKSNYELRFNERVKKLPPQAETAMRSDAIIGHSKLQIPPSSTSNLLALPQKPLSSYDTVKCITTVTATATKKEATCGPPLRRRDQLLNRSGPSDGHRVHHQTNQNYTTETDPEFQYVRSILDHAGITRSTRVRWYSPSLPVDPFVFHRLELNRSRHRNYDTTLRCNRKLLFHLVEEILIDLLTGPHTENISTTRQQKKRLPIDINKDLLLERLWSHIKSFPSANCQDVADIDELVAGDLESAKVRRLLRHPSVFAEAESIALEIEQEVVDSVIGETAAFLAL